MNERIGLYEAFGAVEDRFLLEAEMDLGLWRRKARIRGKKLLRTLLIAAAIAALLGATAYAVGLLKWSERVFPVEGTEKIIVVPNGLKGTKTYEGTGAWWTWIDEHQKDAKDYELRFAQGNDQKRKTSELYGAYSEEAADKLFEIADSFGLALYAESLSVESGERLAELTGLQPFLSEGEAVLQGGYVFPDGSFKTEGRLDLKTLSLWCTLQRFSTGALYPYGGVIRSPEIRERDYQNALGQDINVVSFSNKTELWYLSSDGETFAVLKLDAFPGKETLTRSGFADREALAEYVADRIDFAAICEKNDAAEQILSTPRGAEDNREAASRLEQFYHSPVCAAAREFEDFFTANFYGTSFTGVYGQEGYEDIDAKLDALAESYKLRYAKAKTAKENETRYDNGAIYQSLDGAELHYIPKDALYTRLPHVVAPEEYQRIWELETAGRWILCFTDGPEKISGNCLLYETEKAWVLVIVRTRDVAVMEQVARSIDWTAFD